MCLGKLVITVELLIMLDSLVVGELGTDCGLVVGS